MLTDNQLKHLGDDIISIYQDIEMDIINKLASYLKVNDKDGGTAQWHIKKLNELSDFNADITRAVNKRLKDSDNAVIDALSRAAYANFNSDMERLPQMVLDTQLDNFAYDLGRNLAKIRTNTINSTKEEYLRIVDKATLETSSGVKSFTQSITDSLKDLGDRGISCQAYQRADGTRVNYSIEGLVRRDTLYGVFSIANQFFLDNADKLDITHVYVSQHLGARTSETSKIANHAGWQGRIYLLEGSDEDYKNFYEETGAGTIEGFGGVNCRHRVSAAHDGMKIPEQYDQDKNYHQEQLEKYQRYLERNIRSWKRKEAMMKSCGNDDEYKKAHSKVNEWSNKLDKFTKKNNMRRDFSRERVSNGK